MCSGKQWSLPKEQADKLIEETMNAKTADTLKSQMNAGDLTLEQLRALKKEKDIDVNTVIEVGARDSLYLKHIEKSLTEAPANFDADELMKTIPEELGLDVTKAGNLVTKLAEDRKRPTLIQAVSMLRQNKKAETMKAAYNLVACQMCVSGEAVAWPNVAEVEDLYMGFAKEATAKAAEALADAVGLEAARRAELDSLISDGNGYAFEEDLVASGEEGASGASKKALF